MKFHRKLLVSVFTLLFLMNLIWNASLYSLNSKTTIWNYLYNASYGLVYLVGGVTAIVYGIAFGLKSNLGKMLLFFGLGLLFFEVGNTIWVVYNLVLKVSVPFPSWADAAYMLLYPCIFVGSLFLLKIYQALVTKSVLRDAVLLSIFSFIFIFGLFARPDLSSHLTLLQKVINIYYPMGDVVTLSLALISLRIGGGKIHPSIYILSIGLMILTSADLLFTFRNANGTYWNGDISDLLYTCAAYVVSIALFEIINNLTHAVSKSVAPEVTTSPSISPATMEASSSPSVSPATTTSVPTPQSQPTVASVAPMTNSEPGITPQQTPVAQSTQDKPAQ